MMENPVLDDHGNKDTFGSGYGNMRVLMRDAYSSILSYLDMSGLYLIGQVSHAMRSTMFGHLTYTDNLLVEYLPPSLGSQQLCMQQHIKMFSLLFSVPKHLRYVLFLLLFFIFIIIFFLFPIAEFFFSVAEFFFLFCFHIFGSLFVAIFNFVFFIFFF
jgi:hypothetical protein